VPLGPGEQRAAVRRQGKPLDAGLVDRQLPSLLAGLRIGLIVLPNWTLNAPGYSQTITAAGGMGSLTFSEIGTLPPGLSLSTSGVLSGTPTTAGIYPFTVTAKDKECSRAAPRMPVPPRALVSL
jgi:Putative Ig domain